MTDDKWTERRDQAAKAYVESLEKHLHTSLEEIEFKAGWNAGREDTLKELRRQPETKEDKRSW